MVLTMQNVVYGFVFLGEDMEGVSDYFFSSGNAGRGARFYIYVTQTLIGDGFMVWHFVSHCELELTAISSYTASWSSLTRTGRLQSLHAFSFSLTSVNALQSTI